MMNNVDFHVLTNVVTLFSIEIEKILEANKATANEFMSSGMLAFWQLNQENTKDMKETVTSVVNCGLQILRLLKELNSTWRQKYGENFVEMK